MSIDVRVQPDKLDYGYGERIELIMDIENMGSGAAFVVTDEDDLHAWYVSASDIHVLLGTPPLEPNAFYFDFDVPNLSFLAPGEFLRLRRGFALPITELALGPDGAYETERSVFGPVNVVVQIGFALKYPELVTADPWKEYVEQQELSDPLGFAINVVGRSPGPP